MLVTKKKTNIRQRRENIWGWMCISPMILHVILLTLIPTVFSLVISFTDYNMLSLQDKITKITLDNYKEVFTSKYFWRAMYNTVYYMISIPIKMFLGLLVAYALNSKMLKHGKTAFRVIYYLPAVSSAVAVAFVWRWFFNVDGVFNTIFGTDIAWLLDPGVVKNSLIIKDVWGGLGGTMLMFFAGMQNISEEIYESASLDGANARVKLFKITIPLLKPIVTYMLIMNISGALNAFADNYTMVSGSASSTAVFWIYSQFLGGNYPLVAAASFVVMLFTVIFSVPQYKKVIKDN